MIVHCLFEQSGTFKNAFKKYGIEAYDYWFIGLNPKNNLVFEPLEQVESMQPIQYMTNKNPLGIDRKTARSMIHPQYADRFIRQYILDEEIWKGKQ